MTPIAQLESVPGLGVAIDNSVTVVSTANAVAVAMSGGVDSSTVAAILRERGQPIVGLTMQLWNQRRLPQLQGEGPVQHRCCSLDDVYDARRVAEHFGIPFYVVNFERAFEQTVVRPFVEDYLAGRTPIPCTHCNNSVKFDELLATARQIGAPRIATGHYARVRHNPESGRYELLRAVDETKDQSYFLFGLTQEQLARTEFPLGELTKQEVREVARRLAVPVAEKPESQEICFVPSGSYVRFIESYMQEQGIELRDEPGDVVSTTGEVIGRHNGLRNYTVGQRRGLGLAAGHPVYVVALDRATNRLIVGEDRELRSTACEVRGVNWISFAAPDAPVRASVRIRHRHDPAEAEITPLDATSARISFLEPQRAITPGQAAVFYSGEQVLGGGWLK
ncbi:MAG TPA: tRNA 2-thiouridine(34) synthase MnmA [Candidatus Acidoferrales bacterium]|nr:tRNA 2-thiouridine(34) synthase MnmA [Candidatus Acidoferrales bacterium]